MSESTHDTHTPATSSAAHADHGHGHHDHDFWGHARLYLIVGAVLIFFTLITVALSYVNFGSAKANIIIGMAVATFKVSLVGAIFMHLREEKKTIWRPILFTLFFVSGLFLLSLFAFYDPIFGTHHFHH